MARNHPGEEKNIEKKLPFSMNRPFCSGALLKVE
jgi:hypothetical protein